MMSTEKQACHDEEAQADTLKKEMKIKEGGGWRGGQTSPQALKSHTAVVLWAVFSAVFTDPVHNQYRHHHPYTVAA